MANTLRVKRGLAGTLPNGAQGEPLFTTDTYELYIGKGDGTNQRYQKYIASGTTSQYLRGDGSLETHNLDSLTDVIVSTPSNGQVLQYNGTNWVNATSGYITGSGTAAGQVAVFSSLTNVAGYTTFTYDTVTDKLSMTNGYVNNNLTVDGQLVIKSESGASAYTRGLKFPDNSYGGSGDIAGLRLHNAGGENIILELYAGNDSLDTINFAVAAGGSTYNDNVTINGNKIWNVGNLPSPLSSTGTINSGEIAIFSNGTTVYSDTALFWDNTLNRLGVGGTSPNAQVGVSTSSGVNAFGYKTSGASYYEMVLVYDNTTYGHLFQTARGASTSARNITFLNASSTVSIDESGNMGIGLVTPNPGTSGPGGLGLDIYGSTTAALALHNATSGTGISAGGRIYYNSTNMTIRNLSTGNMTMTVDNGNFTVITLGAENIKVEGSTGKVGIGAPASIAEMLTVNGSIQQSAVTSSMLKANASGKIIAAVSNTDFQAPITLTTTGTSGASTFNGTTLNIPQYQAVLTNPVTGSGTIGYLPKFTTTGSTIGNSLVYDNGSRVMINTTSDNLVEMLQVAGGIRGTSLRVASNFSSGTAVNVLGQIYVDNRSSQGGNRIFLTPNTTSTTPYVHFYEPFTAFNTNGGISIGTSNAITTTPTDSIMHWDANNIRVGINKTNPSTTLDVNGAATFSSTISLNDDFTLNSANPQIKWASGNLRFSSVAGGTDRMVLTSAGAATFSSSVTADYLTSNAGALINTTVNQFVLYNSGGGGNAKRFGITMTNADYMKIYSQNDNGTVRTDNIITATINGNVGIGTANPSARLSIESSGTNRDVFNVGYSSSAFDMLQLYEYSGGNAELNLRNDASTGIVRLATNGNSFFNGGNVGIGTTSPEELLELSSSNTTGGQFLMESTGSSTGNYAGMRFKIAGGSDGGYEKAGIFAVRGSGGYNDLSLVFATNTAATTANVTTSDERMRITSGGNVSVNTTQELGQFNIKRSASGSTARALALYNNIASSVNTGVSIEFYPNNGDNDRCAIISSVQSTSGLYADLRFSTSNDAAPAERMRITSGGFTKISNTGSYVNSTSSSHEFRSDVSNADTLIVNNTNGSYVNTLLTASASRASSTAYNFFYALANGVGQFYVRGDGTIFAQNTTVQSASDIRMKENIINSTDGLNIISALRTVRYDFKDGFGNNKKNQLGFIAQEVEKIFPDIVDVWGDSNEENNPYKSVGPSGLIPVLVKAIQEQQAQIEELKSKLN